ncbi:hypothetical protein ACFU9Y_38570 [Streptomyces sp. NPDC057621]|uniref:hypothetical protein n=1 Tax=Streptomyces sp. NPDC057621 TaxID=3346186 RepID=UPI003678E6F5
MALSLEDLKNMAHTVIEETNGPTHLGTGQIIENPHTVTVTGANTTVIEGDNHGGITQSFGR